MPWHDDGAEVFYGMARLGSACALLGLLLIPLSIGCSTNSPQGLPPLTNNTKGGSGNVGNNGTGGNVGYVAPTTSNVTSTSVAANLLKSCGNSKIDDNEQCDDGNKDGGDGCSMTCQLENPNEWDCPKPPAVGPCKSLAVCGDGKLTSQEVCDDGNTTDGDGCSADCKTIDNGYMCRMPGKACAPICGDNVITGKEQCDDGNTTNSDGCSSTCQIEPGYACTTTTPSTCTKSVCGNGKTEPGESCDAGKDNGLFYGDGKGCSKTCTKEPTCRNASGVTGPCSHSCGDGNVDPDEQCDDGNQVSGDGCSTTCQSEGGFSCSPSKKTDTIACPSNPALQCLVLPVTFRDFDGQNVSGGHPDFFYYGAAATGGRTTGVVPGATATTCVPNSSGTRAAYTAGQACPNSDQTGPCLGLVAKTLGTDGKPVYANGTCPCVFTDWDNTGILGTCPSSGTGNCTPTAGTTAAVGDCWVTSVGNHHLRADTTVTVIQSADSFKQWYTDSTFSTKVAGTIELAATTGGQYQFSSSRPGDPAGTPGRTVNDDLHDMCLASPHSGTLTTGFFPLETTTRAKVCNIWPYWKAGLSTNCCAGSGCPVISQWDPLAAYDGCPTAGTGGPIPSSGGTGGQVTGMLRNFYMTSEIHYLFHYDGTPGTLQFYGDDDVWVFINGQLALDLGGSHERLQGTASVGTGLVAGNTYEIAVFHADTNPRESNYQLTLTGFPTTVSVCQSRCGDGIVTGGEECDCSDGSGTVPSSCTGPNNDATYNGCTSQCKWGPFCGDGNVNTPDEQCDQGRSNGATYGVGKCTSDCKNAHFCGDAVTDGAQGEECDTGGPSDTCDKYCKIVVGILN